MADGAFFVSYGHWGGAAMFVPMITNLASYRTYFANLGRQMGCQMVWANSGRVLNQEISQVQYPIIWVPVPQARLDRTDGDRWIFTGAMVVLTHCAADDWSAQDKALEDMLDIARAAVAQMTDDAAEQFDFDPDSVEMDHVAHWSADNDCGWKIEFTLTGAVLCADC